MAYILRHEAKLDVVRYTNAKWVRI